MDNAEAVIVLLYLPAQAERERCLSLFSILAPADGMELRIDQFGPGIRFVKHPREIEARSLTVKLGSESNR